MKKVLQNELFQILLSATLLTIAAVALVFTAWNPSHAEAGTSINSPLTITASSTAFTVTTGASVRLLATTTGATGQRMAAMVQAINCATGSSLFLKAFNDAPAVANTGMWVNASTTQTFDTFPNRPTPQGSVQGITVTGTCTVLVTEFLTGR